MRLTMRELDAAIEALCSRIAGEIEDVEQPHDVYLSALSKLQDMRQARAAKRLKSTSAATRTALPP